MKNNLELLFAILIWPMLKPDIVVLSKGSLNFKQGLLYLPEQLAKIKLVIGKLLAKLLVISKVKAVIVESINFNMRKFNSTFINKPYVRII